uniref:BEN domain-containing protein n=1 Tax=Syphacia muris TaxID=451379 RepID=A0A0N5ARJ7_9BILA
MPSFTFAKTIYPVEGDAELVAEWSKDHGQNRSPIATTVDTFHSLSSTNGPPRETKPNNGSKCRETSSNTAKNRAVLRYRGRRQKTLTTVKAQDVKKKEQQKKRSKVNSAAKDQNSLAITKSSNAEEVATNEQNPPENKSAKLVRLEKRVDNLAIDVNTVKSSKKVTDGSYDVYHLKMRNNALHCKRLLTDENKSAGLKKRIQRYIELNLAPESQQLMYKCISKANEGSLKKP